MKKFFAAILVFIALIVAIPNFVDARFFFFEKETCKDCGGSGRCPNCHGIGRIIEEYYDERAGAKVEHRKGPCDVCDGTGKCQRCDGSGETIVFDE